MISPVIQFQMINPGPWTQKNKPTTSSTIWMNELPSKNWISAVNSARAALGCLTFVLIVRRWTLIVTVRECCNCIWLQTPQIDSLSTQFLMTRNEMEAHLSSASTKAIKSCVGSIAKSLVEIPKSGRMILLMVLSSRSILVGSHVAIRCLDPPSSPFPTLTLTFMVFEKTPPTSSYAWHAPGTATWIFCVQSRVRHRRRRSSKSCSFSEVVSILCGLSTRPSAASSIRYWSSSVREIVSRKILHTYEPIPLEYAPFTRRRTVTRDCEPIAQLSSSKTKRRTDSLLE